MQEEIKEKIESAVDHFTGKSKKRLILRVVLIVFACLIGLALLLAGTVFAYDKKYANKIYPGVYLGEYSLGGMTGDEIKLFISGLNNRLNREGVIYKFVIDNEEKSAQIPASFVDGENLIDIFSVDYNDFEKIAFQFGREDSGFKKYWQVVALRFWPKKLQMNVNMREDQFKELLTSSLGEYEQNPNDASIVITSANTIVYEIIPEQAGVVFDYSQIAKETVGRLSVLNLDPIKIKRKTVNAKIVNSDLDNKKDLLEKVLSYGEIELSYLDPTNGSLKNPKILESQIADWLVPFKNNEGELFFILKPNSVREYLEKFKYTLYQPTDESKFVMENGRVNEFKIGSAGQQLNIEKTIEDINALMKQRSKGSIGATSTVALFVETVEPKIKLADINNLGITAIFGTGSSTFHNSSASRIKNIARAVELLNGTIIPPGEMFSAVGSTGPYTRDNKYVPEQVIKGNEIVNEVGGGMCQIGTTLFRMAMNSAMPIIERYNHSLVVGYYADPVNGNPGTDATLYAPILDFKFLNDTGGYLLLEAKIDYQKKLLNFTIWGKPDGRSGSYTRPIVSRWINPGAPVYSYSANFAPGVQKCQNAFRGAVASFTYTRFTSTTEKIDKVFTSTYRALPKMCVVGITPDGCSDPEGCATEETGNEESNSPSSDPSSNIIPEEPFATST